jgi:hypothetical protein
MRMIAVVLAATAVSSPAAPQTWQEYSYPEYAFTVTFPANPQVETTTYRAANGRSVPAHVYSVRQNNELFKVTVADLANTGLDEAAVIDHAIKTLSAGGEVKFNIPQRIYRVYGRSLGVQGGDGSRSTISVFDYKERFYQIEAKALLVGTIAQPRPCASTNRWYSPTAARTVPRLPFARYTKPVPAYRLTPRAWTTHGALLTYGDKVPKRQRTRPISAKGECRHPVQRFLGPDSAASA